MRKLIALTLSTIAAAGAVVGLAGTAGASSADTLTGTIKTYATSYSSPSDRSIPVHVNLLPGEKVNTLCFREGDAINGNAYWFMISKGGERGYVHRDVIVPPSETDLKHC
jgi:hypothetical protein